MQVSGKRAIELLEKIGFTRVAGSPEELKAAEILKAECESIGVPAEIESFEIEDAEIETATLEILEPFHQEYQVTGYKCSKNTYQNGLKVICGTTGMVQTCLLAGCAAPCVLSVMCPW